MTSFKGFGLPVVLEQSLERIGFTTPTPIQTLAIPLAMAGRDILGSAQTGTGKTGAFALPLLNKLLTSDRGSGLILTPTRELAVQVMDAMQKMMGRHLINTALLIGGESMPKQFAQLQKRPRLIVGTPGRINDHLVRGSLILNDASFLVLDETDRMLDMGFGIQIDKILKYLPRVRQTLMFSATLPHNIIKMSEKYLNNPERISVGSTTTPLDKIQQEVIHTSDSDKYNQLLKQLDERKGSIIVFVKTKRGAERMAERLRKQNFSADAIHGNLQQRKREKVIDGFRNKNYRILVATDIAARGLDIPHIEHVINYNLPQCPEDYIHRIGRTARAGAEGSAICFISPDEASIWRDIQKLINPGANDDSQRNHHRQRRNSGNNNGNHNNGDGNGFKKRDKSKKWFGFHGKRNKSKSRFGRNGSTKAAA